MKRLFTLVITIIFALNGAPVGAKIRTSAEVLTIAEQHFASKAAVTRTWSAKIVKTISASEILPQTKTKSANGGEPFFIFVTSGGNNVIVSGDDRMLPILGYSDNGFDKNNMSPGFEWLLSTYYDIYNDIQLNGGSMQMPPKTYATSTLPLSVPKLLGGIEWDQAAPYNNTHIMLPNGTRGVTGCVATAMAMVMRHHKYPEYATGRGVGQWHKEDDIRLDSLPFLWDKMLDKYKGTSDPAENQAAVAWLMRAVSAAINTSYDGVSAGAGDHEAVRALRDKFGYDKQIALIAGKTRTSQEWKELMKTEIAGGRPVLYTATKVGFLVGHAFVLDAYENDVMFHINWGWSGMNNGYYPITSLDNYTGGQNAVIGFQKPTDLPYVSVFSSGGGKMNITPATVTTRNGVFSLAKIYYINRVDTFTGEIGLVLFKNGEEVATVGTPQSFSNILRHHATPEIEFKNVSIPPSVEPGSYQIYVATKATNEAKWQPVRMSLNLLPYYNVEISTSGVVFTSPVVKAEPKLISLKPDSDKIYYGEKMGFTAIVQNDGTEYGLLCDIWATSIATGKVERFNETQLCVLLPGRNEIRFEKAIPFAPGEYKLEFLMQNNVIHEPMSGSEKISNIRVLGENFEKYDYYVITSPIVTKLNVTNKDAKPQLTFEMTNVGAKDIEGAYFELTTTGGTIFRSSRLSVSIKKGETQTITLESASELPDGDYTFRYALNYPTQPISPVPIYGNSKFGVRKLSSGK